MAVEEVRKEIKYGMRMNDWQGRLDIPRMRRERFEKAQVALKENGL